MEQKSLSKRNSSEMSISVETTSEPNSKKFKSDSSDAMDTKIFANSLETDTTMTFEDTLGDANPSPKATDFLSSKELAIAGRKIAKFQQHWRTKNRLKKALSDLRQKKFTLPSLSSAFNTYLINNHLLDEQGTLTEDAIPYLLENLDGEGPLLAQAFFKKNLTPPALKISKITGGANTEAAYAVEVPLIYLTDPLTKAPLYPDADQEDSQLVYVVKIIKENNSGNQFGLNEIKALYLVKNSPLLSPSFLNKKNAPIISLDETNFSYRDQRNISHYVSCQRQFNKSIL